MYLLFGASVSCLKSVLSRTLFTRLDSQQVTTFVTCCELISSTLVLCGGAPQIMFIHCSRSTWVQARVPLNGLNHDQEKIMEHKAQQAQKVKIMEHNGQRRGVINHAPTSRRSFLRQGLAVGGAATIGTGLLANGLSVPAFAEAGSSSLTKGDVAILRFLAAAEIIESDLWQQYNELGGIQDHEVPGGSGSAAYTAK